MLTFQPYLDKNTGSGLGKIVVHDRHRVESEVLPRYFNHASFASLRRQLNYFSFARVGKGRQRGATYCNENVVKLEDILRLKRRVVGSPSPGATTENGSNKNQVKPESEEKNMATVVIVPQSKCSEHIVYPSLTKTDVIDNEIIKNINSKRTDESRTDKQTDKRSRRKKYSAIVPVVHLPPIKKRKTATSTAPRLTTNTEQDCTTDKTASNNVGESLRSKNHHDSSSTFSFSSEEIIDYNCPLYLDLTKPTIQHFVSVTDHHNLLSKEKTDFQPKFGKNASFSSRQNESTFATKSKPLVSDYTIEIEQASPVLNESFFQPGYDGSAPNITMFQTPVSPEEHSSYHSSGEITDDEDLVACNVLLALGSRSLAC